MKALRTLGTLAVLGSLLVAGCAESPEEAASDGALRIGLVNPTSGATAFAGVPIEKGALTAVAEINETGFLGEGRTLELTSTDSQGDPEKEISQYRGMVADDILAIVCCTLSASSGSFGSLATQAQVPTVVNGATLPGLVAPPWLYRTVVLPATPGGPYDQVIDKIAAEAEPRTAVVVTTSDSEGQVNDLVRWTEALERNGIEIVDEIDTFAADTDFSVPASNVIASAPDLVVANMQGPKSALLIRTLRERGFAGDAVSSYGVAPHSVFEAGGAAMDGTIFPLPFSPLGESARTRDFVKRYEEAHDETPDLYSAQGYNAVWFIAEAIKAAGDDVSRESVAEAMSQIDTFESVSGNLFEMVDGQAALSDEVLVLQWNADGTQSLWPTE